MNICSPSEKAELNEAIATISHFPPLVTASFISLHSHHSTKKTVKFLSM
jgi:hypothetical protein